jgi:Protein of unknown function (DUF4239)
MMRLVMQPDMVYDYPLWQVGLLLVGLAALAGGLVPLAICKVLSAEFRHRHNDAAAAIFSVIGVTFGVLVAFVAMVAWEGFNRAKAASYAEAAIIADVYNATKGSDVPQMAQMRDDIVGYIETVVEIEWPAQAAGRSVDAGAAYLKKLNLVAAALRPLDIAGGNWHAQLLDSLRRLSDARHERRLAAETTIPTVVWIVTVFGGALTIAFASLLGTPSLAMHMLMSGALAVSGVLVLLLIIALSNPFRGDFRVSTQPFQQILKEIQSARPGAAESSQ